MNNTAKQLVEQLGDNTEITIMADVVYGLDFEYEQLQQENRELKEQIKLFKKDLTKAENICQKYNSRYYDIKLILSGFEKWLEEKIKSTKLSLIEIITFKRCLERLQELKEGKK